MPRTQVNITPIPIMGLMGCEVPVIPGSPHVDAPMEKRTELCAVDAAWMFGMAPTCDIHAEVVCDLCGWDWDELWQEVGRSAASVEVPWDERERHSQDQVTDQRQTAASSGQGS